MLTPHTVGFVDWLLAEGKTLCMVTIFIQKRLRVLCKLNTTIKLKWSHPGETSWSVNHCMATTQLMGKQHIFGNMVKPFSYQKYSGVFDLIEGRQDLLAFSSRIHPKIYKTKSITHTKLLLELTTWHRKETFSETFNREFSSRAKVCKIPKRVFFFKLEKNSYQILCSSVIPNASFQLKLPCYFVSSAHLIVLCVCLCVWEVRNS